MSFVLALNIILRQRRRAVEKLKLLNEALGCCQIKCGETSRASPCGSQKDMFLYLVNVELQKAVVEARAVIDVASSFVMEPRRLQLNISNSIP